MSNLPQPKPPPDVLEISVFGAGVGECVIVHLGAGDWIVIDSCFNPSTRRAVALEYFDEIGVTPMQVRFIAATHWHDDHIKGLSDIVRWAPGATFVWTEALCSKAFLSLIAASELETSAFGSGVAEFSRILEAKQRKIHGKVRAPGMQLAGADKLVLKLSAVGRPTKIKVITLSPSSQTVIDCVRSLAALLNTEGEPIRRYAVTANAASLVFYIVGGSTAVLLGGDLEQTSDAETGWNAVATCASLGSKSRVFKIAHHGSPNGDADVIWNLLLTSKPIGVLTPYLGGPTPRPAEMDLVRLRQKADRLFVAGGLTRAAPPRRDNAVEKQMRAIAANRREFSSRLGHVRLRIRIDDEATTECFVRWAAEEYEAA